MRNRTFSAFPPTQPFTLEARIAVTVVVAILMTFGILGNLITVVTIRSTTKLQTVSNYLLCSICVADLISVLVCAPLWLIRSFWGLLQWELGNFTCKFYWVAEFMTSFITVFNIASFAGLRLYAVRNPYSSWSVFKRNIFVYIVMSWMFAAVASMPLWIFTGVSERAVGGYPSCSVVRKRNINVLTWSYVTLFSFPSILVEFFTFLIIKHLIKQQRWHKSVTTRGSLNKSNEQQQQPKFERSLKRNTVAVTKFSTLDLEAAGRGLATKLQRLKNKKKSTRRRQQRHTFIQLSLVLVSFVFGYTPIACFFIYGSFKKQLSTADQWFYTVASLCLRLSECANPVMYNLGSNKLRKNTKRVVGRIYRNTFIRRKEDQEEQQDTNSDEEQDC